MPKHDHTETLVSTCFAFFQAGRVCARAVAATTAAAAAAAAPTAATATATAAAVAAASASTMGSFFFKPAAQGESAADSETRRYRVDRMNEVQLLEFREAFVRACPLPPSTHTAPQRTVYNAR